MSYSEKYIQILDETEELHSQAMTELRKLRIKEMKQEEINDFIRNVYTNNLELNQKYFNKYSK